MPANYSSKKDVDSRKAAHLDHVPSNTASNEPKATALSVTPIQPSPLDRVIAPGILLFIDQILIAAGGWAFWLIISRLTLPSEIGIATSFYSLAILTATVTQLGLEYPLLKRSSADRSKILGTVIALEMALTALSIPVLMYAAGIMYGQEATSEYIWITVAILALTSLGFVSRFALLGISDAKTVFIFDMAGTAIKFVIGFLLVSQGYGGIGILLSFVAYSAIIVAGTLSIAKKRFKLSLGSVSFALEILKDGLANMPSKLSKLFIMNLSVVLLASLSAIASSDVGVFYIELMISVAAGSMASSMAYMIIPAAASSKRGSDESAVGVRIALSLTAVIAVALLAGPQYVLSLVGSNYSSEGASFFILCLSIVPAAILNTTIAKLNTSNKLGALVLIGSVQISAFIVAFFLLTPIYGLTGAAVAILIAFSIAAAMSLVWSHERSYLRAISVSSASILVGWLAGYSFAMFSGLQSPIMIISASAAVTTISLFAMKSITLSDVRLILNAGIMGGKRNSFTCAVIDGKHDCKIAGSEKRRNYLLLGNYGNFNIGDEMLLKAVIKQVQSNRGENVSFQIPTRNPEFVDLYHKAESNLITPLPINAPFRILRAFIDSDAIIVGGGGIWSRYTGPLAHFIPVVTIAGRLLNKEVEYRAIGLYSTARSLDKFLVNAAIVFANLCSVRDQESYKLLWKINKRKAKQVNDLAIQYIQGLSEAGRISEDVPNNMKSILESYKADGKIIVGISVKPVVDNEINERIVSEFATAINILNAKYPNMFRFIFFPFAKTKSKVESDEELTNNILGKLSKEDSEKVAIFEHSDPLSWFECIKEYVDVFVGMRFHSIIFASEAKKPILCVPYERKILEFLKNKGNRGEISVLPPEALGSFKIVKFLDDCMEKISLGRLQNV